MVVSSTFLILVVFMALLINNAHCSRLCIEDSDCSDLGELICMKKMCNIGVCGCQRHQASRYFGEHLRYKCVPLRKVQEDCSSGGEDGVCAAQNSQCSAKDCHTGKCECESCEMWDGERCGPRTKSVIGEFCGPDDSCQSNSACDKNYVPTCPCEKDHTLKLVQNYDGYVFKFEPSCVPITHGDRCERDYNCPNGMKCNPTTFACECGDSTHVKNYYGTSCKKALGFGEKCNSDKTTGHCNGDLGLHCGDVCATTGSNVISKGHNNNNTCTCGPHHTLQGSTCTPIGSGHACFGDENCKGWKTTALCLNSRCVDGAPRIVAVTLTLIMPILAMYFKY